MTTSPSHDLDADQLDDAWDATLRGGREDPTLSPLLHALNASDPTDSPRPEWIRTVEERLMHAQTPSLNGDLYRSPQSISTGSTLTRPISTPRASPRHVIPASLATAALLLVTFLFGLIAIRGDGGPTNQIVVQASPTIDLAAVECTISPRSTPPPSTGATTSTDIFPLPVNGAPTTPIDGQPFPVGMRPADQVTIDAVARTLAVAHSCTSRGETNRLLALFSDDLFRRTGGQPLTWQVPAPDDYRLDTVWQLPDGRALATLVESTGTTGADIVFVPSGDWWLIDEVAILALSPIPPAPSTPTPTCSLPEITAVPTPPAIDAAKPDSLFPYDPNTSILAGPISRDRLNTPPYTGETPSTNVVTAINETLSIFRDCAAVDQAALSAPDLRYPPAPPTILALFSPDFFVRGRYPILPDPWWDGYPIFIGWDDWRLPASEIRQLSDGRVLALLNSISSPTDHNALVFVERDGRWLIDELAYVVDESALTNGRVTTCSLPEPTEPRPAPDWQLPLTHQSVLPEPIPNLSIDAGTALSDDQRGRVPAMITDPATIPTGAPLAPAVAGAITATVTDLRGCIQLLDFPQRIGLASTGYTRSFDLYSDDLFRRMQPTTPLTERWWRSFRREWSLYHTTVDQSFLDSLRLLPDGRALGIIATRDQGSPYLALVFVENDGRWLLDELAVVSEVPPAPPSETPTPSTAQTNVVITLADIIFTPNQITVPANQEVTITLLNQGVAQHSFVVPDLGINQHVQPGESINIRFTAPAGDYRFVCEVPGHEEAGMVGVLNVIDTTATPTT